jgi:cysteine synthase B
VHLNYPYYQAIQIIGVQPEDGAKIAGIRRWPKAYLPKIFDATYIRVFINRKLWYM